MLILLFSKEDPYNDQDDPYPPIMKEDAKQGKDNGKNDQKGQTHQKYG